MRSEVVYEPVSVFECLTIARTRYPATHMAIRVITSHVILIDVCAEVTGVTTRFVTQTTSLGDYPGAADLRTRSGQHI